MEINKRHTLFGERAERVTTSEANAVYNELFDLLYEDFSHMRMTKSLPCKTDHGDIDIVYCMVNKFDPETRLRVQLGESFLDFHKNGEVSSVLYHSKVVGKNVHVDFILANEKNYMTKLQYFSYNDFSGIFGMLAKKYNFKYGSEGFFKRYRDSRGNWHDVFVSRDLTIGMEMLGYDPRKWEKLETYDDIVLFMLSSPMFDYRLFVHDTLNQSDKKSYKRPVIKYVVDKLRESGKTATITDENHYWVNTTAYEFGLVEIGLIEDEILKRKQDRLARLQAGLD